MQEKKIERLLSSMVKELGGVAYKFTSPNRRSVPDRLCVLPNLPAFFVECKTIGEKPTVLQAREIARLRSLGQEVFIVDNLPDLLLIMEVKKDELGSNSR